MKAVERILIKLVMIQLLILIIVQGIVHEFPVIEYINKLSLYEGVTNIQEQTKLDVFQYSK